ncbi:MAG: C25 family cysteine peptidase [Acidobacteriota bacterium]
MVAQLKSWLYLLGSSIHLKRYAVLVYICGFIFVYFQLTEPMQISASGTPTTQLIGLHGSSSLLNRGDFVSSSQVPGLNTYHSYFIEVTPSLSQLQVDLFDADFGMAGASELNDRIEDGDGFTGAACRYELRNPSGTLVATLMGTPTGPAGSNNAWINFFTLANPPAGHWELRADVSSAVTIAGDVNEFGIRAHDGDASGGGTELNIYADTLFKMGNNTVASSTKSFELYPYITASCTLESNDFDFDSNGSIGFTSRTGAFTTSYTDVSPNNQWDNPANTPRAISGWTTDFTNREYGIWQADYSYTGANYGTVYIGSSSAANPPPTSRAPANTFRYYFPTDTGAAPIKPYVYQDVRIVSGPNPPVSGSTTTVRVNVIIVNPTPFSITFSASNLVTITVPNNPGGIPDPGYQGSVVSQGTIVSQPSIGGRGTITWNPGVVTSNTTANLAYDVTVRPSAAGQRIPITGSTSSGGTTARYVDETGNTTQTRATYTFGPLCELAVTSGIVVPTLVRLETFQAISYENGVLLKWHTNFESDNLGFNIYREESGKRELLTRSLIAGSALLTSGNVALTAGRTYSWFDDTSKPTAGIQYWLEDIDLNGQRMLYGPITPEAANSAFSNQASAPLLSRLGRGAGQRNFALQAGTSIRPPAITAGQIQTQRNLAGQAAVKLSIKKEGWYRVTQAELIAAGLDTRTDPRFLQLFVDGKEQAISVIGEADGRFDTNDAIEFYATGLDTPATDTRVYWLIKGSQLGARVKISTDRATTLTSIKAFSFTAERKDRTIYFPALKNGDEDNFFGPVVASEPVEQSLSLQHVFLASPPRNATLEVSLLGVTDLPTISPDHSVRVLLNGNNAGLIQFDGQVLKSFQLTVLQEWLREGDNIVTLVATGGEQDVSLINYVRLTYLHSYDADTDRLDFTAPGGQQVRLDGFSNSSIKVIDITNPELPIVVQALTQASANGFAAVISVPQLDMRRLIAFTESRIERAADIKPNQPSRWHQPSNASDIVMLAHRNFVSNLVPLKTLRQAQGRSAVIINIEDIYDEFSFGAKNPQAIKDFLTNAKAVWQRPPRFVLLVGDASFDARNYLGAGELDLLPTKLLGTNFLETASDDWFADLNGDGVTEMAIGRLPVRTSIEADRLIAKIINYEKSAPADWQRQVMIVADDNDIYDFETAAAQVQMLLPTNLRVTKILRSQDDIDTIKARILTGLNSGNLIVNYLGHGSVEIWAAESLLSSTEARTLTNGGRLPFFVNMNCLNGFFHDIYTESLAEALLRAENGGAVAVWASSGLTEPASQVQLDNAIIQLLFTQPLTLGEAVQQAKQMINNDDLRRTWILFADPAMRLK